MAPQFTGRTSFVVPVTLDNYAPERITFPHTGALGSAGFYNATGIIGVTALIESAGATGAIVELWLAKGSGVTGIDADFFNSGESLLTGAETWPLASYPAVQIRVKSAGSAGTTVVTASAD